MKFMHTSDWHLGRSLYGERRDEEYRIFLDWILETVNREQADLLIVAGDIFDTGNPPNSAVSAYYNFLYRLASQSCCRHAVIIAGNHDSPSFLEAPAELLGAMNIHVIGTPPPDPADCVLQLQDADGQLEALVCAVPYLRERDLRRAEFGESIDEKRQKSSDGLVEYYRSAVDAALALRGDTELPLIATGHLFTAGGRTTGDDGVRDSKVGNLGHIRPERFPQEIDYLALGHLHVPQLLSNDDPTRRYSGSPLPIGFGEAAQQKTVVSVEYDIEKKMVCKTVDVPVFQPLEQCMGTESELLDRLGEMVAAGRECWLDISLENCLDGQAFRREAEQLLEGSAVRIIRLRRPELRRTLLVTESGAEQVDQLSPDEVFQKRLDSYRTGANNTPLDEETVRQLWPLYRETVRQVEEEVNNVVPATSRNSAEVNGEDK